MEKCGLLTVVVYTGIFADMDHNEWRQRFLLKHKLLAMISLPEDLFYPTSAPTSIMIAEAHTPLSENDDVFMARIWNDGYEKLKGKRVERSGSQIDEIVNQFHKFIKGEVVSSELVTIVKGGVMLSHEGNTEWSPQQWLPQPLLSQSEFSRLQNEAMQDIFEAVTLMPDLADIVINDFGIANDIQTEKLPYNTYGAISNYFDIENGRSTGVKNYIEGAIPYISSSDSKNSIINLVDPVPEEVFDQGGITITAFGKAALQPWAFMARGNGGSAVRVLIPKYKMSLNELLWFVVQINMQQWRFFYARMAIMGRISHLEVSAPPQELASVGKSLSERIKIFSTHLRELQEIL